MLYQTWISSWLACPTGIKLSSSKNRSGAASLSAI
nr:MAG TPA: hypothetical protein [Caudoviricetes sp.]